MRVPAYEEITQPHFENPNRFEQANRILHSQLGDMSARGIIYGAFLFGSVSFEDTNPGSDRDLIVAYQGPAHITEEVVLPELHNIATTVYSATGVPLEMTCATLQQLHDGEHLLSDGMLAWLKDQQSQFPQDTIGNSFVPTINERRRLPDTDFTELESWLSRTHNNLIKAYLQGEYFQPYDLLGMIYSLPHVAARKVIDTLERNNFITQGTLRNLTKKGIADSLYTMFYPDDRLSKLYVTITNNASRFYDEFLPTASGLTQDEYDQIVRAEIENNLPRAIYLTTHLQLAQRTGRAHLRLLFLPLEKEGKIVFSEGDEDSSQRPYLPHDMRAVIRPQYLIRTSLQLTENGMLLLTI